jgi:thioredoxin-like negative regulator of GroEL
MLAPTLQRIAAEFRDRMITIKVNVDKRPNLAARYEVSGIPTVLLFRGGRPVMRFSGALPYDRFKAEVLRALDAS